MLKIFKDHISKQCILDDFDFYEDRQKKILEKKAKQQHFHKQVGLVYHFWIGLQFSSQNTSNASLPSVVYRLKFGKASQVKRRIVRKT